MGGGLATQSKFAAEAQYNTEPECTVLCPVMLHRVLVKMYPVGETYEKVEETEEQVLNRMVKSSVNVFKDIMGIDITRKKEGKGIPLRRKCVTK